MQKITPRLCFNENAEEAVNFYISILKNSKITGITRYGEASARGLWKAKGLSDDRQFQT